MDFCIVAGDTLFRTWRWATDEKSYVAITEITNAAPVVITATGHNIPPGWLAAVVSVDGMDELSVDYGKPRYKDYHAVTVVDPNTVSFNDVNSSNFTPYVSGGYLMFNTPVDLTAMTVNAQILDAPGGNLLLDISAYFTVDSTNHQILLEIPAAVTALITWTKGVFRLETINGGVVTTIDYGNINVGTNTTADVQVTSTKVQVVAVGPTIIGGSAAVNFADEETPSGSIDGTNIAFTLAYTPILGSVKLYRNGQRYIRTVDYTISSAAITLLDAPDSGDSLIADYRY